MADERQRIDKWLWHARIVRTRTSAAALVSSGHVRVNSARIDAPSRAVKAGDVLTIALDARVRVLKVVSFAERRGAAPETAGLYEDISPLPPPPEEVQPTPAHREAGTSRPTKRDRRVIARFTGRGEI